MKRNTNKEQAPQSHVGAETNWVSGPPKGRGGGGRMDRASLLSAHRPPWPEEVPGAPARHCPHLCHRSLPGTPVPAVHRHLRQLAPRSVSEGLGPGLHWPASSSGCPRKRPGQKRAGVALELPFHRQPTPLFLVGGVGPLRTGRVGGHGHQRATGHSARAEHGPGLGACL